MNAAERMAFATIRRLARKDMIVIGEHAAVEMRADGVVYADVVNALLGAKACAGQPEEEKADWRVFGGVDHDDRSLVCCVNITDEATLVVVVTVYR